MLILLSPAQAPRYPRDFKGWLKNKKLDSQKLSDLMNAWISLKHSARNKNSSGLFIS
jgi:hypothetical protein